MSVTVLTVPDCWTCFHGLNEKTEGSAIRRIGYDRWIRNIAVALGNALRDMENESVRDAIVHALNEKKSTVSEMVDEHIVWALHQGS